MPVALSARERAHLKGRAHALEPILHIGLGGLSDAGVAELELALDAHGLIKVKINDPDRDARHAIADAMCARTGAAIVHRVGKVVVLWRPISEGAPLSS